MELGAEADQCLNCLKCSELADDGKGRWNSNSWTIVVVGNIVLFYRSTQKNAMMKIRMAFLVEANETVIILSQIFTAVQTVAIILLSKGS